ncbi:MAG: caspase family protein [Gemmataceae bacterium]
MLHLCAACLLLSVPAAEPKGNKYALVVGVNAYKNPAFPTLGCAENDAAQLAAVLKGLGYKSVVKLTGKDATKEAIFTAIEALVSGKETADTVLVALAGHGMEMKVDDPDGKEPSRTYAYFCPHDAERAKASFSTGLTPRLISLSWVLGQFTDDVCSAGRKIVLVDACRVKTAATSSVRARELKIDAKKVLVPDGVCAMFSCSPGESAFEVESLGGGPGHGVFFHFVLEGLRGKASNADGEVTWGVLVDFVTRRVGREVSALTNNPTAKQTPHSVANVLGELPVFASGIRPPRSPDASKGPAVREPKGEREYQLGIDFYLGRRVKMDKPRAALHLRRASDDGHPIAKAEYASFLLHGVAGRKDAAEAAKLGRECIAGLKRLAEDGTSADAVGTLGRCYQFGLGVGEDFGEAMRLYRKGAELGDGRAMNNLGVMYEQGKGVERDVAEALKWFRLAAKQGYNGAQFNLGLMYEFGEGVEKDEKEAAKYYQKAADAGEAVAQINLGSLYLYGRGVEKDEREARRLFESAAEQNSARAMFNMGLLYEQGRGVGKDEKESARWYRKAADLGDATSQNNLGYMYQNGKGLPKDEEEAVYWFRKASDQGHAGGTFNLGVMVEHGRGGLEKDREKALELYRKAAKKGFKHAEEAIKNLEEK